MPIRKDVYNGVEKMLLAAGCATVIRGYWFPEDESMVGLQMPIASYVEQDIERLTTKEGVGYERDGRISIRLFVETGQPANDVMGGGKVGYAMLDDLFDAILQIFEAAYPTFFSQTTRVIPVEIEPWYWYRPKNLPMVAGEIRLAWKMGFA